MNSDFKNKRFPIPKKVRKIGGQRAGYNGNSGPTPVAHGSMNNTATRHNTLQHTATHETCAVADGVTADTTAATHCTYCDTLQHTAAQCNILQNKASCVARVCCNTLQHTAAHCDVTRHALHVCAVLCVQRHPHICVRAPVCVCER